MKDNTLRNSCAKQANSPLQCILFHSQFEVSECLGVLFLKILSWRRQFLYVKIISVRWSVFMCLCWRQKFLYAEFIWHQKCFYVRFFEVKFFLRQNRISTHFFFFGQTFFQNILDLHRINLRYFVRVWLSACRWFSVVIVSGSLL